MTLLAKKKEEWLKIEPGADAMAEERRVSRIWLPNFYSFHLAKVQ